MHAVVIGAGAAGLGTALALARDGHEVTILERDATPLPPDPHAAFDWDRSGAPQVRHSHAFLARLRNLLRDRWPDVLDELMAAGATDIDFCDNPPAEMVGFEREPGDDDLVALACRRTTFEWVLRRVVDAQPHARLRDGVAVEGLEATTGADGRPQVTGVRITGPDGAEIIPADVVVASVGRRSAVPRWLGDLGVTVPETVEDTGIVYLSRFYRLAPGAERPAQDGPIGGDLGYLKYAVFQGDNDTWSVTFAVSTGDTELRRHLLDPDVFDRAARTLPTTRGWATEGVGEAITGVHVMGGLLNRSMAFLDDDGAPRVLGFHAVGDAHTCTNPLYGRGCSLGIVAGTLLTDALAAHPDDPDAASRTYEASMVREVAPWYRAAVTQDRMSRRQAERDRAALEAAAAGDGDGDGGSSGSGSAGAGSTGSGSTGSGSTGSGDDASDLMMRDLMREGLMPAVRTDPVVFRAFVRSLNLLDPPEQLMGDPDLIGRVLTAYQDRENRPPEPVLGPPRSGLLEALALV